MDRSEHFPMMQNQFPAWADKIDYWDVSDIPYRSFERRFTGDRTQNNATAGRGFTMSGMMSVDLPGIRKMRSGKVREIFDLGDTLLIVATDRISAFDCILPDPIPGKGQIPDSAFGVLVSKVPPGAESFHHG